MLGVNGRGDPGRTDRASRSAVTMGDDQLFEDEIIEAVCNKLRARGYSILERSTVRQHGDDIVAEKSGVKFVIEATGAGRLEGPYGTLRTALRPRPGVRPRGQGSAQGHAGLVVRARPRWRGDAQQ